MALIATPTMQAITKTISFKVDRTAFVSQLTLLLAEWNYDPQATVGDAISFARPVIVLSSLHRLTVVVEEAHATLLGPAELVTRLARTLDPPSGAMHRHRQATIVEPHRPVDRGDR